MFLPPFFSRLFPPALFSRHFLDVARYKAGHRFLQMNKCFSSSRRRNSTMSVPCSDQDFRPSKSKNASLPPGVRAERCWCGHLAKVKESEDFSDKMGMKFFMCSNYNASPPRRASLFSARPPSPPPLCMWYHWIDTEQPAWALQEIQERSRRARASFQEAERAEKEAEERERALIARRAQQARNRELKQQEIQERAARRYAEEQAEKERREAQRQIYRERAAEAEAAERRGDKTGKYPRWTQDH